MQKVSILKPGMNHKVLKVLKIRVNSVLLTKEMGKQGGRYITAFSVKLIINKDIFHLLLQLEVHKFFHYLILRVSNVQRDN